MLHRSWLALSTYALSLLQVLLRGLQTTAMRGCSMMLWSGSQSHITDLLYMRLPPGGGDGSGHNALFGVLQQRVLVMQEALVARLGGLQDLEALHTCKASRP